MKAVQDTQSTKSNARKLKRKQLHQIKVRESIEFKNKLGLLKMDNKSLTSYDWKSESHSIGNFSWE